MLTEAKTYDELYNNFRWDIPARFRNHAEGQAAARSIATSASRLAKSR